jgi:hypothetical protein
MYRTWSSGDGSDILLIEGKPGSGKSTLTKYFKRHLSERGPQAGQIVATFFYSYREGQSQRDHSNMLRSVLYDVLDQNEAFFFHFQERYRKAARDGNSFQWPYNFLKEILLSFRDHPVETRLHLIVDAVDESEGRDRLDIVNLLRLLCAPANGCNVSSKVFIASRPIEGLNRSVANTGIKVITMQEVNKPDILKFAGSFLGPKLGLFGDLNRRATEIIIRNAQGVFVWVHLVREEVLKCSARGYTGRKIVDLLESLPKELEGSYRRMLDELESRSDEDVKDGVRILQFVLFTCRPLRLEELRHALAIPHEIEAEFQCSSEFFEDELIHGIDKRIIHCAGNFLEIKRVHGTPLYATISIESL